MTKMIIDFPIAMSDVAAVLRNMSYIELRDFAHDLCMTASSRLEEFEEGFDVNNAIHWQELLADWAEAN